MTLLAILLAVDLAALFLVACYQVGYRSGLRSNQRAR